MQAGKIIISIFESVNYSNVVIHESNLVYFSFLFQVPQEKCWDEPRETCRQVPRESCWDEPRQTCRKVPRQECTQVPHQKCTQVPNEVCTQVKLFQASCLNEKILINFYSQFNCR